MTQDYKERIIKYLTNNYSQDPESTTPFFASDIELVTMQDNFSNYFDTIQGYIQGKDGKGNDLDTGFVYGLKNNKGIIVVVDNNFNILQDIDSYNTGTKFGEWICLNIDITNGNIFGLDEDNGNKRFLLINNFLIKTPAQQNYEVKLRNDYVIDLAYEGVVSNIQYIEKCPSASLYLLIGTNNAKPHLATYKIEVGATNELINYGYNGNIQSPIETYNLIWSGENYSIRLGCWQLSDNSYKELVFDGTNYSLVSNFAMPKASMCMNNQTTYFIFDIRPSSSTHFMVLTRLNANKTGIIINPFIFQREIEYDNSYGGFFYKKNNQIYGMIYIATNMPANPANTIYEYTFGTLDDEDNFLCKTKGGFLGYSLMILTYRLFNVVTSYNLLTYNLVGRTNLKMTTKQIYNDNNWNYTDYQDYNSMIPNSGLLYDEDGNIIFARNLYNKTLNGNSTMSTLEVPNMLLNDITISQQDLLGQTNGTLITNTEDIEKNIYEDLFINFNNTITMQNQNTQQYVYNLNGATRLNNSISNTADYTNATLNRIRINYVDNTSYVKSISPAIQVSQFVYKYEFNIYVTKLINTIELISNDTNTTYQTIDASQLEINKAYKISQNVEIQ